MNRTVQCRYSSNILWNHTDGKWLNQYCFVCFCCQFLLLFKTLSHKDFSSLEHCMKLGMPQTVEISIYYYQYQYIIINISTSISIYQYQYINTNININVSISIYQYQYIIINILLLISIYYLTLVSQYIIVKVLSISILLLAQFLHLYLINVPMWTLWPNNGLMNDFIVVQEIKLTLSIFKWYSYISNRYIDLNMLCWKKIGWSRLSLNNWFLNVGLSKLHRWRIIRWKQIYNGWKSVERLTFETYAI